MNGPNDQGPRLILPGVSMKTRTDLTSFSTAFAAMGDETLIQKDLEFRHEQACKVDPKFDAFCNRIYNISGANHTFRSLTQFIRCGLSNATTRQASFHTTSAEAATAISAVVASFYDYPFWVIPKRMSDVILNIDPPDELYLTDMVMGFPSMYFILPRGAMKGDLGEEIAAVSATFVTNEVRGESSRRGIHFDRGVNVSRDHFIVTAFSECRHLWYLSAPVDENGIIARTKVAELPQAADVPSGDKMWSYDTLMSFVFTALAVMNSCPEVMGEPSKRLKRIPKTGREVWSPRILGEKYAVQRSHEPGTGGGTVAFHWRRGH